MMHRRYYTILNVESEQVFAHWETDFEIKSKQTLVL